MVNIGVNAFRTVPVLPIHIAAQPVPQVPGDRWDVPVPGVCRDQWVSPERQEQRALQAQPVRLTDLQAPQGLPERRVQQV